ncbi:uncharacterized protein C11orf24 homolog [Carettochelys insculpta]|uniref:uncharacterized protein C11orf24 homolog n=1 Tax=Carettochelys insculpta TaxID=44489 RepID=UPI003EBE8AB0
MGMGREASGPKSEKIHSGLKNLTEIRTRALEKNSVTPRPAFKMWTAVVFFLLFSLCISGNRISILKERGTWVIQINRLNSEKHCKQACRGLLPSGNRYCNWSVFYQNHCVLLHCRHLHACQNTSTQDIKDLLEELVLKRRETRALDRIRRQEDSKTSQKTPLEQTSVPSSSSAQVMSSVIGTRINLTTVITTTATITSTTTTAATNATTTTQPTKETTSEISTTTPSATMVRTPSISANSTVPTSTTSPTISTPVTNNTPSNSTVTATFEKTSETVSTSGTNATLSQTTVATTVRTTVYHLTKPNATIATSSSHTVSTVPTVGIGPETSTAATTTNSLQNSKAHPLNSTITSPLSKNANPTMATIKGTSTPEPLTTSVEGLKHVTGKPSPTLLAQTKGAKTSADNQPTTKATTEPGVITYSALLTTSRGPTNAPKTTVLELDRGQQNTDYDNLLITEPLTQYLVDTSSLLAVLLFGIIFFITVLVLFAMQAYESYKKKGYMQVDYLINGMYADSEM